MSQLSSDKIALLGGALFAIILAISIYFEFLWLALVPAGLLMFWWGIQRMDLYLATILIAVPFSLNIQEFIPDASGLYMPTEPLLLCALLLFVVRTFSGWPVDKRLFSHPLTYVIGAMMLWLVITTLTSWDMVVSAKFTISRAWFVVGFFFLLGHIMLNKPSYRERMVMYLLFPLAIVVIYTIIGHSEYGFSKHAGHWVMKPFFKDHTSYGAVLAMMLPPAIALTLNKNRASITRVMLALATTIISLGLILSFTRAAWVSLVGVGAIYVAMRLGFKWKTLVGIGVLLLGTIFINKDSILIELQRNKQDSSDNITEHVESITNVSSDDSNLERLNRWSCAVALFSERPLTGWGPGTYQFVYAPYQSSDLKTGISTNNADGGNAHSEYLGPLAEQGIPGLIFMLLLIWMSSVIAFRLYIELEDKNARNFAIGIYLGLMTYFIHGVLNNYLDTDKASAPFWGFIALLVVLDIENSARKKRELSKQVTKASGKQVTIS